MRQVAVLVPVEHGPRVKDIATGLGAANVILLAGADGDDGRSLLLASVANGDVGPFIRQVQEVDDVEVTYQPAGVLALRPPWDTLNDQAADPGSRSPLEVYLGALQSVGNWIGFVSYAAAAGIIAWSALFLNNVFLQVAAMLIAPFAGPAMLTAIGTASGDRTVLGRGVARYVVGIGITVATAGALHGILGTGTLTQAMVDTSKISALAVVLPLAAGAAGALNLSQPERSSLVPGAATGVLVAAALAPPAALLGMAGVMGEWDMVKSALFLLALQLSGINLTGAVVFRLYGLQPDTRLGQGHRWAVVAGLAVSTLALAALLVWQFAGESTQFQRTTVERRAEDTVQRALDDRSEVALVRAEASFTRSDIAGQDTLLVTVWAQYQGSGDVPAGLEASLADDLGNALQTAVDAVPLVQVDVLRAPPPTG